MSNRNKLIIIILTFFAAYFIPFSNVIIQKAISGAFLMLQDYAQKHIILCLVPAFFIAGAIGVFLSQGSVMKYLGAKANKIVSYSVASVSGSILAVCSCTVLPLFSVIYRMGAGIGPATAFLYSGPAINIMAIVLTAKVLGLEIGIARAVGAIVFAIVIGLLMAVTFRHEKHIDNDLVIPETEGSMSSRQNAVFFFILVAILVFANWAKPSEYTPTLVGGVYMHHIQAAEYPGQLTQLIDNIRTDDLFILSEQAGHHHHPFYQDIVQTLLPVHP